MPNRLEVSVYRGTEFVSRQWLDKDVVMVGRHPLGGLAIDDPSVASMHAMFRRKDGVWSITQMGRVASMTLLNGKPISVATLEVGDVLQLGKMLVRIDRADAAETSSEDGEPKPAQAGDHPSPSDRPQSARSGVPSQRMGDRRSFAGLFVILSAIIGYGLVRTTPFQVALDFARTHWDALLPVLMLILAILGAHAAHGALPRLRPARGSTELPMQAGSWAGKKAFELELVRLRIVPVASKGRLLDRFRPVERLVLLRERTFFGRTPFAWASAAIQLAHVWQYERGPFWMRLAWRLPGPALVLVAINLIVGNLLFGEPLLSQLALAALWASLACRVPVLVEAAAASLRARQWLTRDSALPEEHRGRVSLALAASFGTSLAAFLFFVLLLVQYGHLVELVEQFAVFEPAAWPSRGPLWIGAILSVIVALWALNGLKGPKPGSRSHLLPIQISPVVLPLGILLALVWDQDLGPWFQLAVVMAATAAVLLGVLIMPFVVIATTAGTLVGGVLASNRPAALAAGELAEVRKGEILALASATRPPTALEKLGWYARRLAVLPLLWLLWASWL